MAQDSGMAGAESPGMSHGAHVAGPGTGHTTGQEGGGAHATVGTYVLVGIILTVITAVEVAIFYIPALAGVLVPVLLTLSATKFVIVVLFYMHLRYDHALFGRLFFGLMGLALFVVVSLVILFKYVPRFDPY
jgi:cytochrome c oxidase subunit 4